MSTDNIEPQLENTKTEDSIESFGTSISLLFKNYETNPTCFPCSNNSQVNTTEYEEGITTTSTTKKTTSLTSANEQIITTTTTTKTKKRGRPPGAQDSNKRTRTEKTIIILRKYCRTFLKIAIDYPGILFVINNNEEHFNSFINNPEQFIEAFNNNPHFFFSNKETLILQTNKESTISSLSS